MKFIQKESLEKMKSAFSLEDFISRYLTLRKSGASSSGKCPFHKDDSPSFHVYPDHYYCFGCRKTGDAISFVQEREGLGFAEAAEAVASRVGFALEYEESEKAAPPDPVAQRAEARKNKAYFYHTEAANLFHTALLSREGESARSYLRERGISIEMIKEFHLGLCPGGNFLLNHALEKNWDVSVLVDFSLLAESSKVPGKVYDFFRERLMIPIQDDKGRIVAFGGRFLGKVTNFQGFTPPKYLNSKDTAIFSKSLILFNYFRSRSEIAKSAEAILVEGYFDCLSLYASGVKNVVAALSTAISDQHLHKLFHFAKARKLVLSFDMDKAGKAATLRFFQKVFPEAKFELRCLSFSESKDPDEFVQKYGSHEFRKRIDGSVPAIEQCLVISCEGIPEYESEARLRAVRRDILPALLSTSDLALRELALAKVAHFLKLSSPAALLNSQQPKVPGEWLPTKVTQRAIAKKNSDTADSSASYKEVHPVALSDLPRNTIGIVPKHNLAKDKGISSLPVLWHGSLLEMKLVAFLLYCERAQLPKRLLRILEAQQGHELLDQIDLHALAKALDESCSEQTKTFLSHLFDILYKSGGQSVIVATAQADLNKEISAPMSVLLALANEDVSLLGSLKQYDLLNLLNSNEAAAFRPVSPGRPQMTPLNGKVNFFSKKFAPYLLAALRDARLSARQGALTVGLERILLLIYKEYLLAKYVLVARNVWKTMDMQIDAAAQGLSKGIHEAQVSVDELVGQISAVSRLLDSTTKVG